MSDRSDEDDAICEEQEGPVPILRQSQSIGGRLSTHTTMSPFEASKIPVLRVCSCSILISTPSRATVSVRKEIYLFGVPHGDDTEERWGDTRFHEAEEKPDQSE